MASVDTEVQRFYKDKNVFLTGGTGFLGKVFIEKILRATDVACLFILIRDKKDKNITQRIDEILKEPLFEMLLKHKTDVAKRIVPISGDCMLPNLGIGFHDRNTLIANVDVIVHSAATVRFNEPLSNAVDINIRATIHLLQMARAMPKLQAFVHVSSAFANCVVMHIEERFYAEKLNGRTAQELCNMRDTLGADSLNAMTKELCQNFPNTYCYTKAMAEEAVQSLGRGLPVCIFRPCIVVPTAKEPMAGWIDNLYGPTTILYGASYGILRVIYVQEQANAALVPVDFCANMMLVSAWATAKPIKMDKPAIYNLVPVEENQMKWIDYIKYMQAHGIKMPLAGMIWYPHVKHTSSMFHYNILCLIYHTIPSYIVDFIRLMIGKKQRVVQIYRKMHKNTTVLNYFVENSWTFDLHNTRQLWNSLSNEDKQLFPFDMRELNWSQYFYNSLWGMRRFLAKEDPSTVPHGLKLLSRMMVLHYSLEAFIYTTAIVLFCWTLCRIYSILL